MPALTNQRTSCIYLLLMVGHVHVVIRTAHIRRGYITLMCYDCSSDPLQVFLSHSQSHQENKVLNLV